MKRFIAPAIVALMVFTFVHGAIAQTPPVVPPTGTTVTIPWGDWFGSIGSTIFALLGAIITWAFRFLPANIVSILRSLRADQLLQRALDYGYNTTAGAVRGRTSDITVNNQVLATALQYAVESGAPKLLEWMGGKDGVLNKLIARFDAGENAISPATVIATTPSVPAATKK